MYSVLSWNICFKMRTANAELNKIFAWKNRKVHVKKFVEEFISENPLHILNFQEVQPQHHKDLCAIVGRDYHVFSQQYYEKRKFSLLTLVPKEFLFEGIKQIPLGSEYKRFLVVEFKQFILINLHHHVGLDPRQNDHKLILGWVRKYLEKGKKPVMIVGDFNSFDNDIGVSMMRDFAHIGMYDNTSYLKSERRKRINHTFSGLPSDKFQKKGNFPLDHMLTSEGIDGQGMIADSVGRIYWNGKLWGASDHYACTLDIRVR